MAAERPFNPLSSKENKINKTEADRQVPKLLSGRVVHGRRFAARHRIDFSAIGKLLLAVAIVCGMQGLASARAAPDPQLERAVEALRASQIELRREEAAYRTSMANGSLKRAEQNDYAEFVAGLRTRLLEQCEAVRRLGGEQAISNFDCVRLSPQPKLVAVTSPRAVQTDEERQKSIAAKLDAMEGDIDEKLQKTQQEIRQTGSGNNSQSALQASASGVGAGTGGQAGQQLGSSRGQSAGTASATTGGQGSQGMTVPGGRNTAPPSQGSSSGQTDGRPPQFQRPTDGGVDDDIIARQLREAAERETDPTLKEKLWAEYRKYKEAKR